MSMSFEMYMKDVIQPMREDLTKIGFTELLTPEQVDELLPNAKGTALLVINSVCGCAAGNCRPGVARSLENSEAKPDHLFTVFAGQEKEATARARDYLAPHPPSSPSIALFKDGELVHFIPRQSIEDRTASQIAEELVGIYGHYCK